MIKRTIYFGNPAYLSVQSKQLIYKDPKEKDGVAKASIPIEDIGMVVLDHPQITISHSTITELMGNNAALLVCNASHMPLSLALPLHSNDTYSQKVRYQLEASEPLKKQLWKQTVSAKIYNQSRVLHTLGIPSKRLDRMHTQVNSGDPENYEAQAAAIYWDALLSDHGVTRGRFAGGPNALFNYAYAILRAVIARSLVGSGCLPVLGIHHQNKYNPYCLADDIMEPFRPIADLFVMRYLEIRSIEEEELCKEDKAHLLQIPALDVIINGKSSPLMVGSQRTTASLIKCFTGELRKIQYPIL